MAPRGISAILPANLFATLRPQGAPSDRRLGCGGGSAQQTRRCRQRFCQPSPHRDATHPLSSNPPGCVVQCPSLVCHGTGAQPATRMPAAQTAMIQRQERTDTRETCRLVPLRSVPLLIRNPSLPLLGIMVVAIVRSESVTVASPFGVMTHVAEKANGTIIQASRNFRCSQASDTPRRTVPARCPR